MPERRIGIHSGNRNIESPENKLIRMQGLSFEAWHTIAAFSRFSPQKQELAIGALTTIGVIVDSRCREKWNTKRWAEVLGDITEEHRQLVQDAISKTSEVSFEVAFRNLFQMLETGVSSMVQLQEKMRINNQSQANVAARVFHTRQSPASKPSID